jgi:DNA replication initiation complex subunit (GINS family)
MADSVRQQIVDAFIALLTTITTVNEYETNLGLNITEWRTEDWQESDLPGCDVRDPDETTEVKGQHHYNTVSIELEAKVKNTAAPGVVRDVIADINKAIGTVAKTDALGSLVTQISPVENESIDFEKKDRSFGGVLMKLNISYRIKAFKPYTVA